MQRKNWRPLDFDQRDADEFDKAYDEIVEHNLQDADDFSILTEEAKEKFEEEEKLEKEEAQEEIEYIGDEENLLDEEDIEAGTMYVRTRFSFGGDTRYVVEYKDGRKELVPDLANNIEIKNNETSLYFLLKNVNYKEVKNLSVKGGIIYVGIYNTNTYKEVSKTGFSIRFGYINFKIDDMLKANGAVGVEKDNEFYKFNCDLSQWNTSKVTNVFRMFAGCESFEGKGLYQ